MTTLLLAAISGQALIHAVLVLIVIGLVAGLLWWLIGYLALPEPVNKIATALVAILVVIVLINALLSLIGKPFIEF